MQNVIGIVGYKNNGKTTLVERLVAELTRQGLAVSTVKHAHHSIDLDQPGRDSWRHREAGAAEVMLATGPRWFLMRDMRGQPEPTLEELLARMAPVDLVLVEGFKSAPHAKIEVHLASRGTPLLAANDPGIVAVASDAAVAVAGRPVLPIDDTAAIARFVLARIRTGGA